MFNIERGDKISSFFNKKESLMLSFKFGPGKLYWFYSIKYDIFLVRVKRRSKRKFIIFFFQPLLTRAEPQTKLCFVGSYPSIKKESLMLSFKFGPGRIRTCDQGIMSPLRYRCATSPCLFSLLLRYLSFLSKNNSLDYFSRQSLPLTKRYWIFLFGRVPQAQKQLCIYKLSLIQVTVKYNFYSL